jgi:hypothetical protein
VGRLARHGGGGGCRQAGGRRCAGCGAAPVEAQHGGCRSRHTVSLGVCAAVGSLCGRICRPHSSCLSQGGTAHYYMASGIGKHALQVCVAILASTPCMAVRTSYVMPSLESPTPRCKCMLSIVQGLLGISSDSRARRLCLHGGQHSRCSNCCVGNAAAGLASDICCSRSYRRVSFL